MTVVLEQVTKKFGETVAVSNLNLEVKKGSFMVLLGPSGCGKTTILNIVAGLETPTSGNVYINDTWVNEVPAKDRNVAMVFQTYALYPHMTVYDNIAFPLKLRKLSKEEIDERVGRAADLLRIGGLLDRKPRQLSGGQKQRVALGRAIVRDPEVFLMDEPLSNLDAKLRVLMRTELLRVHKKLKVTTIYVTHDQEEAMTLGDEVALLKDGLLQQIGPPSQLYRKPANEFVGGFVGSPAMNFFKGTVSGEGRVIDFKAFTYEPSPARVQMLKRAGVRRVSLGVRPEDVEISKRRRKGALAKAKIEVIESVGRELHMVLSVGDYNVNVISDPTARFDVDSEVWFGFNRLNIHFFDENGNLIE
jgi:multiple sugar transport system ATP-binding protein